jgi:hypothetical protein
MKMNATQVNSGLENQNQENRFGKACLDTCKEVLTRINNAKEIILAEARETLKVHEQLLRLALNEAEALARQTLYPDLVFPDLAVEKMQAIAAWKNRQRQLGGQSRKLAA